MDPFDEREQGFEAKFHFDEEMAFKVAARRDKLLGLWVAGKIGLSGAAAEDYAKAALDSAIAASSHQVMTDRMLADLAAHDSPIEPPEFFAEIARLAELARAQIYGEVGTGDQTVSP
jgi:hypothetical protein